jgi:uncharacterized protein
VPEGTGTESMVDRMRRDLTRARRSGDTAAVTALRTALSALANAEAVPVPEPAARPSPPAWSPDVPRRALTPADQRAVLVAEIADRQDTVDLYTDHGRPQEASELRRQIQVLAAYLD